MYTTLEDQLLYGNDGQQFADAQINKAALQKEAADRLLTKSQNSTGVYPKPFTEYVKDGSAAQARALSYLDEINAANTPVGASRVPEELSLKDAAKYIESEKLPAGISMVGRPRKNVEVKAGVDFLKANGIQTAGMPDSEVLKNAAYIEGSAKFPLAKDLEASAYAKTNQVGDDFMYSQALKYGDKDNYIAADHYNAKYNGFPESRNKVKVGYENGPLSLRGDAAITMQGEAPRLTRKEEQNIEANYSINDALGLAGRYQNIDRNGLNNFNSEGGAITYKPSRLAALEAYYGKDTAYDRAGQNPDSAYNYGITYSQKF